jgi:uroporphyrinogen III methyltransferase/synthase
MRQGIRPPALLVIGNVVACRTAVKNESSPLAGKTVLVPSAPLRSGRLCALLRERGAEPLPYPTTAWKQTDDVEGWARFRGIADTGGVCLFTQETEVGLFVDGLLSRGLDLRSLGRFKIAAVGTRTGEALLAKGLKTDITVPPGSEALAISALASPETLLVWIRGPVEIPVADECRKQWGDVVTLTVGRDVDAAWEPHWKEEALSNPPDYAVFTTCSEVHGFARIFGPDLQGLSPGKPRIVSMDSSITQALRGYSLTPNVEPECREIEELVSAILKDAGSMEPPAP